MVIRGVVKDGGSFEFVMIMSVDNIDWYPLPEVPETSLTTPLSTRLNQDNNYTNNLSILSLKSSTASQPTPSTDPLATPTQLDQLWEKFLDVYVSRPHPFFKEQCTCTCHRGNHPPIDTPTFSQFNVSPPLTYNPHLQTEATPTPLSLQEACLHFKNKFVRNSKVRQETLKQRQRPIMKMTTPISSNNRLVTRATSK